MGINTKGKRQFLHNEKKYVWSIVSDYDYSNLVIVAVDKSIIIKYYLDQFNKKEPQTIMIEQSPKLESGHYHFTLQINPIVTPATVKTILEWYDTTDCVNAVKYKYRYPHKNVLTELDFRGGKIDFLNSHEEALFTLDDIVGDTLVEVSYPNQVKMFVSWNGAKEGFVITAIAEEDWHKPLITAKTNYIDTILKNKIQEVIDNIVELHAIHENKLYFLG